MMTVTDDDDGDDVDDDNDSGLCWGGKKHILMAQTIYSIKIGRKEKAGIRQHTRIPEKGGDCKCMFGSH